jgi:hypothetical protein
MSAVRMSGTKRTTQSTLVWEALGAPSTVWSIWETRRRIIQEWEDNPIIGKEKD